MWRTKRLRISRSQMQKDLALIQSFTVKYTQIVKIKFIYSGINGWQHLGVVHHPNRKKNRKKGKCNQYDFLQVLPKFSCITFKTILKTLSALRNCPVTIIREYFLEYLDKYLIFLREIYFGSTMLSSCCGKHQNFDFQSSS